MAANKNRDNFIEWLSGQDIILTTDNFLKEFEKVSDYAIKHKICRVSFWEIYDIKVFNSIARKISTLKLFKFLHKQLFIFFEKYGKYYSNFLLYRTTNMKETHINQALPIDEKFSIQNKTETDIIADKETISNMKKESVSGHSISESNSQFVKHQKFGYGIVLEELDTYFKIHFISDEACKIRLISKSYQFCVFVEKNEFEQETMLFNSNSEKTLNSSVVVEKNNESQIITNNEIDIINSFFNNNMISLGFQKLLLFQKSTCKDVYLETRGLIIGVKRNSERFRFYSDKNGLIKFSHCNEQHIMSVCNILKVNIIECYNKIEATNKYFLSHPDVVALHDKKESKKSAIVKQVNRLINNTIEEAITEVLKSAHSSMNAEEIYEEIKGRKLYSFGAQTPVNVVRITIERTCDNSNYANDRKKTKSYFHCEKTLNGKRYYTLLTNVHSVSDGFSIVEKPDLSVSQTIQQDVKTIDFDVIASLVFTKPISFIYKKEEYSNVSSWTDLYVKFFKLIYEDYSAVIPIEQSFFKAGRHDFGRIDGMVAPKHIAGEYYLETNISATDIVKKISTILAICGLSKTELNISYCEKPISDAQPFKSLRNEKYSSDILRESANKDVEILLKSSFQYGIRLSSVRDLMRFRLAAEEVHVKLPDDDATLKGLLVSCGTIIDNKLFARNESMEDELRDIIEAIFASGVVIIYYESLFYAKQQWMELHHITSSDILKEVLKRNLNEFNYTRLFLTKDGRKTEFDALSEELKRVWGENPIADIDELTKRLPFVPYENIQRVLFATSYFVWTSERNYLLIDRIYITEQEKVEILEYVEHACEKDGFASLTDIPLGCIPENNGFATTNILYSAIYNKLLKDKYRNNGKILTIDNSEMNIVSILSRRFQDWDEISFDEVNDRVTELNGGTKRQDSFEILYTKFVRISQSSFVSSRKVRFDVEEIDRVLSEIYNNGFGAIRDVTTFAMFPVCGVTWNHYVLESYCYRYSRKYYLSVLNFNNKNAGIIIDRKLHFSYDQMLSKILSETSINLNETDAGEFLFQSGLLAKRKYANLDDIIREAKKIRKEQ